MPPPIDQSYRILAARSVRRQIKQLTAQIEGIQKADDAEPLHRARVASRRLRQALDVFEDCFAKERVVFWRKEIRRLGRGLGKARDRDVQIAWIADWLARLDDRRCVPGVAAILVRCQRKRDRLQPDVLRSLRRLLAGRALHEMLAATKKLIASAEATNAAGHSPVVFERAEGHIAERARALRAFEPCLARSDDVERHHAMRIAAKRLRYTMELFRPLYEGELDRVLEAVKQVQSLLGDVHDSDVWQAQLDKMFQKESKRLLRHYRHSGPLAAMAPGLEFLKSECQRRRQLRFASLVEFWREQTEAGLWDELAGIIGRWERPSRGAPPGSRPPAAQGGKGGSLSPPLPAPRIFEAG